MALLVLASCVQYDEELWINPDGSGKATLRLVHRSPYENPEEVMRKAQLPGINLTDSKISRVGPDVIYQVSFSFKDIESFNNVNDQIGTADFWGKISLNREPGGKVSFKRRIALGSPEADDPIENLFSQSQVEHPVWNYKLHLPWKIISWIFSSIRLLRYCLSRIARSTWAGSTDSASALRAWAAAS
jgi:hypothetical protein